MIVQISDSPLQGTFVLKLYDRIHASQLRKEEEFPWNPQVEADYQQFVLEGHGPDFFRHCTTMFTESEWWADDERETRTKGQHEAYLQFSCRRTCSTETTAYKLLHDLQGKQVPTVLGHPYLRDPSDQVSEESREFLDRPGLLLEYIEGFPLTDLAEERPRQDWQYICDEAIRIVHLINEREVCNRDIKTRSFIVRQDEEAGKLQVCMIDFRLCVFRSEVENESEFREWQASEDQEGAVGRVTETRLDGGFIYVLSPWAEALLRDFKMQGLPGNETAHFEVVSNTGGSHDNRDDVV